MVLQLNRFCTAEGVVTKSRVPIALPSTLRLPVLVEGSTTSVRYHLSAVVLHLGDTPQRGHYRVLLVEPTGGAWLTDDGIPTKRPSKSYALSRRIPIFCISAQLHFRRFCELGLLFKSVSGLVLIGPQGRQGLGWVAISHAAKLPCTMRANIAQRTRLILLRS